MGIIKSMIDLNIGFNRIKKLTDGAENLLNNQDINNLKIEFEKLNIIETAMSDKSIIQYINNPKTIDAIHKIIEEHKKEINSKKDVKEILIMLGEEYNKAVDGIKNTNSKLIKDLSQITIDNNLKNSIENLLKNSNNKLTKINTNDLRNITYFDPKEWEDYVNQVKNNYESIIKALFGLSSIYHHLSENGTIGKAFAELKESSINKFNKIVKSNEEINDIKKYIENISNIKVSKQNYDINNDVLKHIEKEGLINNNEIEILKGNIRIIDNLNKIIKEISVLKNILDGDLNSIIKLKNKKMFKELYNFIIRFDEFFKKDRNEIFLFIDTIEKINKIIEDKKINIEQISNPTILSTLKNNIKNADSIKIDLDSYSFLKNMDKMLDDKLKESVIEQKIKQLIELFEKNKVNKPNMSDVQTYIENVKRIIKEEKEKGGKVDESSVENVRIMCEYLDNLSKKLFNKTIKENIEEIEYIDNETGIIPYFLEVKKIKINYMKLKMKELELKEDEFKKLGKKKEYKESINDFELAIRRATIDYLKKYRKIMNVKISKYENNKYKNEFEKRVINKDDKRKEKGVLKLLLLGSIYLKQLDGMLDLIKEKYEKEEEDNNLAINIDNALRTNNNQTSVSS